MRFTRLRLAGFKSFVDPIDFSIGPGLTGIVGPNGCGKSNLLEALRWVMGATSAKAMRGGGMDDVIFAGADGRPARSHAEVTLTVENDDASAPAPFRFEPILEVTRRIDRGEGSTYRVNGGEVRARDIQLLFADASTGANSPALVRQGQISELIAARPQNRRRILEEAAGVSGLQGRRHEAELRVGAAEANLARLDDVRRELEVSLTRLKREARGAERYKTLAARIRSLRVAILYDSWLDACRAAKMTDEASTAAGEQYREAVRSASVASAAALTSAAGISSLQDEQAIAITLHQRLILVCDRLERELIVSRAEIDRNAAEQERLAADIDREARIAAESGEASRKFRMTIDEIEADLLASSERGPELERSWRASETNRRLAEAAVEGLASRLAASRAQTHAARQTVQSCEMRLSKTLTESIQVQAEAEALNTGPAEPFARALEAVEQTSAASAKHKRDLGEAERVRETALAREINTRAKARAAEEALAGAIVELEALQRASPGKSDGSKSQAILEHISLSPGYELALAAALGDDLDKPLDREAPAFWSEGSTHEDSPVCAWHAGITPLSLFVQGPIPLGLRLSFIGLIAQDRGDVEQPALKPGQRLVSMEGGLWRWDGYVARPGASLAFGARLQSRSRQAELQLLIDNLGPRARETKASYGAAKNALSDAEREDAALRSRTAAIDASQQRAVEHAEALRRDDEKRRLRLSAINEALSRLSADEVEARRTLDDACRVVAEAPEDSVLVAELERLRASAIAARGAADAARFAFDGENRERSAQLKRLADLRQDSAAWLERARQSASRLQELEQASAAAKPALAEATMAPTRIEADLITALLDRAIAEARRCKAIDALALSEIERSDAERRAREAERVAGHAAESRAGASARLEAANLRVNETRRAVLDYCGIEPHELAGRVVAEATACPPDRRAREVQFNLLEQEQASLGAVNLLAEDEVEAVADRLRLMAEEQSDLTGAISKLRQVIRELNLEGRERLKAAFVVIDGHFRDLFTSLFQGGSAELRLVESDDPLDAGLEIFACPPGKRMAVMSLMSGGEQALTAVALIFGVFLANPAPICVLDEVDAPLDNANVERFCNLMAEMKSRATTRFLIITHSPLTMSRMDQLFGVTMQARGVSQLVSVELGDAVSLVDAVAR